MQRIIPALAAALLPSYVHSSGLTLHIWNVELFAFFPLTVNEPRQVLFLRVLQNYFSCVLLGIEAEDVVQLVEFLPSVHKDLGLIQALH